MDVADHEMHSSVGASARGADADPPSGATSLIGVVGTIIIIAIVLGLEALYYFSAAEERKEKVYQREYQTRTALHAEQVANLNRFRLDRDTGRAEIPIELAKDLVLKELKSSK